MREEQVDTTKSLLDLPHPMFIYLDSLLEAHSINRLGQAFEFRFRNIPDLTKELSTKYEKIDMFIVWALLEHMAWEKHIDVDKQFSAAGELVKYNSKLTMNGYLFRMHGGYKQKNKIEKSAEEQKRAEMQLTRESISASMAADRSTTKMNDIELPESLRTQKFLGITSAVLGGLSMVFIIISTIVQFSDRTQMEVKELGTAVKNQSKTIESITISLKDLSASIAARKIDTVVVKFPLNKVSK